MSETAPPTKPNHADAVKIPGEFKVGPRMGDRLDAILAIAEPLLGRKPGDPHARVRQQVGNEKIFVTMSAKDKIRFPVGHPREKQHRYRWEVREDGIELGYLIDYKDDE